MIIGTSIFIFGLLIGSFINIVIVRISQEKPLAGPLFSCPYCGTKLKAPDFISLLSYLVSSGKCRYCQHKLSSRHLGVELLTAIVTVTLFVRYGLSIDLGAFLFLMYILIAVFFIDFEHQIIPNQLVILGMIGGTILFFYNLFRPFLIYADTAWWNPLLGMVSGSGFLLAVSFFGSLLYKTEEVMGMGDVKLFAPIGLFLGWRMTLLALFISVVLGGMISLLLILLGKATRKSTIPFGPFIVIGVFITLMWGWDIAYWYLHNFWYY